MSCTPQQCEELNLLLEALQLELEAINVEMASLESEKSATESAIETAAGCIDYCDCNGGGEGPVESSGELKTGMTPEMKARMDMLPVLMRLVRRQKPAASDPRQV